MPLQAASLLSRDSSSPERELADAAVERLFREQQAFVWRNARRLGCADEWVDDVVQEVFLVAARRLPETWAAGGTCARLVDWYDHFSDRAALSRRGRARYRGRVQDYARTQADVCAPNHESSSDAARELRELLARLDDGKRVVLILMELEGMTSAEVAAIMGVPQGTVDSRLRVKLCKALREMIEADRRAARKGAAMNSENRLANLLSAERGRAEPSSATVEHGLRLTASFTRWRNDRAVGGARPTLKLGASLVAKWSVGSGSWWLRRYGRSASSVSRLAASCTVGCAADHGRSGNSPDGERARAKRCGTRSRTRSDARRAGSRQ